MEEKVDLLSARRLLDSRLQSKRLSSSYWILNPVRGDILWSVGHMNIERLTDKVFKLERTVRTLRTRLDDVINTLLHLNIVVAPTGSFIQWDTEPDLGSTPESSRSSQRKLP